ncbi:1653_t:CDS:2 [Cetraspora pellucida]|uniref:1653_t:CDS:1 n=1 Tax=Cetraspora pellucida TaxID=1433469 RepID=A0A9N9IAZ2_9GLOM|nr:1653_t:CDS:2 [Cetraspora pellucida]
MQEQLDLSYVENTLSLMVIELLDIGHLSVAFLVHPPLIKVTSIVRDHNYNMISDICLYAPKYRKLLEKIKEKIRFYVTKGNIRSKQIYPLLVTSFPNQYIHKRDLYNKVQKIKAPLIK